MSKQERDEVKKLWENDKYFDKDAPVEKSQQIRRIRQLTPKECERLQTLPDGYTECDNVTNTERIEAIGNGWTVDVIAHILNGFNRMEICL